MSKIALEGNASGTGTLTIASQNTNSNYTLTLPNSTGTIVVTGGAQTIEFAAGTAAAPSITFTGDTNTGIFSPAADTIAFTEGGAEAMRINSSGNILINTTSSVSIGVVNPKLQIEFTDYDASSVIKRNQNDTGGPTGHFIKSRGTTNGSNTVVQSGDTLGQFRFWGTDGTDPAEGASITAQVDGTPGNNDMPGRLIFSTTADGSDSPTERMRIDSSGKVGIGTTSPSYKLTVSGDGETISTIGGTTTGSTYLAFRGSTGTRVGYIGPASSGANSDFYIVNEANNAMLFYTNNTERVRITSGGNFGIGTNNPQQALDVNGVARAAYYFYQTNASSYASPSSTTLTMTYTGEGSLYLISASNHSGSSNVSHTMWMLSYSGTGASVVTQIATGGSYTPTISVSGSTVTITNNSGGSRVIYASFIRLL